jgi:PAS domain S-box-containing protein
MLEQELFDLFERTSDPAFIVNDDGEICSWNKAAERLFGYSRAETLKKNCHDLLQGRDALGIPICGAPCSIQECAAKRADIPNFDLEVKAKSGRRLWVGVSVLVYDNPRNGHRLIVHLTHDITERKKNEELLRKMMALSQQLSALPEFMGRPVSVAPLSENEREILRMFSIGKNSTEIARKLGITQHTLRNHLHHINQKLHTHNRLEAVTHAIQRKLV